MSDWGPRAGVALAALLGVFIFAAGMAWACVPQPLVSVEPHASGLAGSVVTVSAVAVPGSAEVRWNGIDGPLLATATGPNLTVAVTIPDVEAGLYALIVVGRGPGGGVAATGRSAFEVTGPMTGSTPAPQASSASGEGDAGWMSRGGLLAAGTGIAVVGGVVGGVLSSALTSRRRGAGRQVPDEEHGSVGVEVL